MKRFVETKFWLLLIIALVIGLIFPVFGKPLNFLIFPILMLVLFLTYLKIDYVDILKHIKQPRFVTYILVMYLVVIPALVYGLVQFFDQDLAVAFLLLCAIPPGVASPLLTDLVKGNTPLSVAVTFLSYIFAPFTVVLLFFVLTHKTIALDLPGLARILLLLNFVPLLASQLLRQKFRSVITKTQKQFGFINILLLTIMVYVIVANQASAILSQPLDTLFFDVLWLYLLFLFLFLAGYFMAYWKKKDEKIALAVSKSFMNNALAIGLAFAFFDPRITILMVLSEIPWNTILGPFTLFLKKLR